MAQLTERAKVFVVQRLACFDSPKTIADAVKEEFGLEMSRQAVENYDPEKTPKLSKKWATLHQATRDAFLAETRKVPAAHRAVRVHRLARAADKAETKGNIVLMQSLLKQIAEEVGDAYTNHRVLTGKGGAPIAAALTVSFVRPGGASGDV